MPRASAGSAIVLVSGATTTVARFVGHPALGRLVQPRSYNRIEPIARSGMPWGEGKQKAESRKLKPSNPVRLSALSFLLSAFPCSPDGIIGSWEGTLWLWRCWRPALLARGLPPAIVLQDGATPDTVPWDELAAVFVGASTRWKLSRTAELLVRMARARGLWTHVGRVNTFGRLARVEAMGAHSFDGSQFSRWPDKYLPRFLARLEYQQQPMPEVPRAAP